MTRQTFLQGTVMIGRQQCLGMDAKHFIHGLARQLVLVGGIDDFDDYRNSRQFSYRIGRGKYSISRLYIPFLEFHRLGPQHQMWEIHIPRMGRDIGTLGHETHIA